jgi:LysM repeat protein
MNFRKLIISGAVSIGILLGSVSIGYAQDISYTIRPGDTFWIISRKYGVPMDRLMAVNNANQNTVLYVGQKIVIPTDYGIIHTVRAGDTFWIISQKYGVSLSSLMAANNATEDGERIQ